MTCGIPAPVTIRFAPTFFAIDVSVAIRAAGSPCRSISFATADPQRVHVPHVEVTRTASTPAAFRSRAISFPIRAPAS